jgi:hypothetical protein
MRTKPYWLLVLWLTAASAFGQDVPNLVVRTPLPTALFVLDGTVDLDTVSPGGGLFHLPADPLTTTIPGLDRYRLVGYTPQGVRLAPGKHRLYVVIDDTAIDFDVDLGTEQQVWEVHPRNSFVQWTAGFLGGYGLFAVPFAIGPTYVDVVHKRGFRGGAIALSSGAAALVISIWSFAVNVPSVKRVSSP